jgi:signal transduction histidine kinase
MTVLGSRTDGAENVCMGMTLSHLNAAVTGGLVESHDRYLRRAIPIGAPLLVLLNAVALFLGAPLGMVEVLAAFGAAIVGAVLLRGRVPVCAEGAAAWMASNALVLGMVGLHPEAFGLVAVANIGLLVVGGLTMPRLWFVTLAVFVVSIQAATWTASAYEGGSAIFAMTMMVALGLAWMVSRLETRQAGSDDTIRALAGQRSTVARLYEVASSIGASTTRTEALPDLLGAVAGAVRARSCAMVGVDDDRVTLTLFGPVWVNGSHIPVDDCVTAVFDRAGFVAKALRSTRAIRFDRATAVDLGPILTDLGLSSGLLAPLRLEGAETGLLIVGDPIAGSFDDSDIAELTALAAPASLVLAQVGRHEAAVELAAQLHEIAEMKSDFVSMVSHELRTPLTSVMGALDTLGRPELAANHTGAQEMVQTARRQATRLGRLIDDLLVMSRIDSGVTRPVVRSVVVADAVAEAVTLVPNCEVRIDAPRGLTVAVDPDHLGQIAINLIENASKYGGGTPIRVSVSAAGFGEVAISVVDHGPGIPAGQRERVFERFVRLERSPGIGGTGLGLAIVKMLAEGMDGRVYVEDTPGGGATFVVILPAGD